LETTLGAVPWRPWDFDFDLIIISFAVKLFAFLCVLHALRGEAFV
jgi:hypothetical protein